MNYSLSKRVAALVPSATLAAVGRAKALREQGVDVIDLSAGESDFDTPEHIKDAAWTALRGGDTKYPSPVAGKNALRNAIREYMLKYCGLDYALGEVVVTVGAKDAIMQAFTALLNPGDEVIIPVPYWVSYPEQVKLVGGTPVFIRPTGNSSKVTARELKAAITPRTRMVVMNSPNNPSGAVYSREELESLLAPLQGTDIIVLSDELYHRLILIDAPHVSIAALPGMYERTVIINGFSKTYAMTGWRLGWACGPESIISAMAKIQGQTTSGAVSFVQTAAVTALNSDQACVKQMRQAYRERSAQMATLLNEIRDVHCEPAQGGFVCIAHVSKHFARLGLKNNDELAALILEKSHVATVSGSAFGTPDHIRLSFAASMERIEAGLGRIAKLLG